MKFKHILSLSVLWTSQTTLATLTPSLERGEEKISYKSSNGITEICVIPNHFLDAKYSDTDLKLEKKLCSVNFYFDSNDGVLDQAATEEDHPSGMAAICPKLESTNPGVNIYSLPALEKLDKSSPSYQTQATQLKANFENQNCSDKTMKAEKIGKYKNSTSCSYTPAILAYYHVSRILGGIANVPPAVLRTMDINTHMDLAVKGMKLSFVPPKKASANVKYDIFNLPEDVLETQNYIFRNWNTLRLRLQANLTSKVKDQLFTDDGKQTYGAFVVNPKGESFYADLFNKGEDRVAEFKLRNSTFNMVKDARPIQSIVGTTEFTQNSLQTMLVMRDVTEFILLDHILDQQDRFGNIAYQDVFAYLKKNKNGQIELKRTQKMKKFTEDESDGQTLSRPFTVKSMVLKDNDCGVAKEALIKRGGLLNAIAHMNPDTYHRLLEFSQTVRTSEATKFFRSNLMFTSTDYNEMVANIDDAVKILKSNCQSGKLKLDLDIATYFTKGPVTNWSCE